MNLKKKDHIYYRADASADHMLYLGKIDFFVKHRMKNTTKYFVVFNSPAHSIANKWIDLYIKPQKWYYVPN